MNTRPSWLDFSGTQMYLCITFEQEFNMTGLSAPSRTIYWGELLTDRSVVISVILFSPLSSSLHSYPYMNTFQSQITTLEMFSWTNTPLSVSKLRIKSSITLWKSAQLDTGPGDLQPSQLTYIKSPQAANKWTILVRYCLESPSTSVLQLEFKSNWL